MDLHAWGHQAHARGGDEEAIALAPVHHLGVAGDHAHAAAVCGGPERGHQPRQLVEGQALLQDEGRGEGQGPGPGHGQIVHGAVHGQLAQIPAGEAPGMHHETVRGESQPPGPGLQDGAVVEARGVGPQGGQEHTLDELLHQAAAAAVGHLDRVGPQGAGAAQGEGIQTHGVSTGAKRR
jgi:hypothetical protein